MFYILDLRVDEPCRCGLIAIPESGDWFVQIIAAKNRLVFGVYRRHMKTIGYLGQIDRLFGAAATTRSGNTIRLVLRIFKPASVATWEIFHTWKSNPITA